MGESKQKPSQMNKKEDKNTTGQMNLENLISDLKKGEYVIPGFQREFKWGPTDINDLMRSIFRDYYIGNLLLWEKRGDKFDALNCEPIRGAPKRTQPDFIVLDGQQRLSAMYYSFFAPNINPDIRPSKLKKRTFFFIRVDRFMEEAYEEAFHHDSKSSTLKLFGDREKQFEQHMFPLALIGQGRSEMRNWIRDYEDYWKKKESEAINAGDKTASRMAKQNAQNISEFEKYLLKIIDDYQIAYIKLNPDMELQKVCETFTKINTKGVKLDIFDLMNAYLRPKDLELKKMWLMEKNKFKLIKTDKTKIFVLQAMSVFLQHYFSQNHLYNLIPGRVQRIRKSDGSFKEKILVKDKESFVQLWQQTIEKLCSAIDLLLDPREYGVILSKYIPYTSILPVFAVLNDEAGKLAPEKRLSARRKIDQWYWVGTFMKRYQSQADSTNARDYQDLKKWFDDDAAEPAWMTEFKKHPDRIKMRETNHAGSIYNGVFNLLILKGAKDWIDGKTPPLNGKWDNHHIIPKSWGEDSDLRTSIDTILNRTPMSVDTNRNFIGKKLPNEYLQGLIDSNGKDKVLEILESHLISPTALEILRRTPFTPDDYEDFIDEREKTLLEAIEKKVLG